MYSIEKSKGFDKWLRKLKDLKAKVKILLEFRKLNARPTLEITNLLEAIGGNIQVTPLSS